MKYLLIIWACLCTLFNLQAAEYKCGSQTFVGEGNG